MLLSFRPSLSTQRNILSFLQARKMSSRSYREAVDALNSLQTNAATLDALRASGGRSSSLAIPEMIEYLQRIGYNASHTPLNPCTSI